MRKFNKEDEADIELQRKLSEYLLELTQSMLAKTNAEPPTLKHAFVKAWDATEHIMGMFGRTPRMRFVMHQNEKITAMREALYQAIKDMAPADRKHLLEILRCDIASHLEALEKEDGKQ